MTSESGTIYKLGAGGTGFRFLHRFTNGMGRYGDSIPGGQDCRFYWTLLRQNTG